MKRIFSALLLCLLLAGSCTAPQDKAVKPTRNLIVMITDGTSSSLLSTARWYHRYMVDSLDWPLNVDPYLCGFVQSRLSNAIIPDSAPAMSGYMTGVPCRVGNLSIYPQPDTLQGDVVPTDPAMAWHPAATVLEGAKLEMGKAVGVVATVLFPHATPGATATHSARRGAYTEHRHQMVDHGIDVVFAAGVHLIDDDLKARLEAQGITYQANDLQGFRNFKSGKVWSLFGDDMMDYEIDRNPEEQPSLHEMTGKAIELLSAHKNGFFLMVEGSKVDYAAHAQDPIETITEFLEFDRAVKVALDFAKKDGNTTVLILPDHGNSGITLGDRYYSNYAAKGLDSMFVNMKNYRAGVTHLRKLLAEAPADQIAPVFFEWTGIGLKPHEEELLRRCQATGQFGSTIQHILTSRTHIGFTSGNHTGEDVFLAAYNPKGQRPMGMITNTELNQYMQDVLGMKVSLSEHSKEWFSPYTEVFGEGFECSYEGEPTMPVLVVRKDEHILRVPSFKATAELDGKPVQLCIPTVFMRENNMFYLPADSRKFFN